MAEVEFEDNRVQVKQALNDAVEQFLYEVGLTMQRQVANNTRTDSGQTAGAWDYAVDKSKQEVVIGNPLENAVWEELGTGEYALEGKGRRTPWYVPVEGYTGHKKPTYEGKVVIVHGNGGKKYYKTDGKKPNRALYNAYITKKDSIIRRAEQVLKARFDE